MGMQTLVYTLQHQVALIVAPPWMFWDWACMFISMDQAFPLSPVCVVSASIRPGEKLLQVSQVSRGRN